MKVPFRSPVASPAVSPVQRRRLRYDEAPLPIYAVGDIHGCYQELIDAERRIAADLRSSGGGKARVVYLGDYVDRGSDSREVLDHLSRQDHADDLSRLTLCGNHDDTFLNFMRDPKDHASWLDFGGIADAMIGAGDDAFACLERLAQGIQHLRGEFWKFIEKQHAMVSK